MRRRYTLLPDAAPTRTLRQQCPDGGARGGLSGRGQGQQGQREGGRAVQIQGQVGCRPFGEEVCVGRDGGEQGEHAGEAADEPHTFQQQPVLVPRARGEAQPEESGNFRPDPSVNRGYKDHFGARVQLGGGLPHAAANRVHDFAGAFARRPAATRCSERTREGVFPRGNRRRSQGQRKAERPQALQVSELVLEAAGEHSVDATGAPDGPAAPQAAGRKATAATKKRAATAL